LWLSCVQITQPKPYSLTTKFSYLCSLVPQVAVDKLQWMVVMNELSSSNCKTRKKKKKNHFAFLYSLHLNFVFDTWNNNFRDWYRIAYRSQHHTWSHSTAKSARRVRSVHYRLTYLSARINRLIESLQMLFLR
jgi:hypothetical protein